MRVGFFLNNLDTEYQLAIYRGARAEALKLGIDLLGVQGAAEGGFTGSRAVWNRGILPSWRLIAADGILLLSSVYRNVKDTDLYRELRDMTGRIPAVSIGARLFDYPAIIVKNRESMELLMEHLIFVHGYRKFIYAGGPKEHPDNIIREDVFRKAISGGGGQFPGLKGEVYHGVFNELSGMEILRRRIAEEPGEVPDCIVAACDTIALGIQALLQGQADSRWRNCPVTGFDDINRARLAAPPLTTVRQPLQEQGALAVRVIRDLIRGEEGGKVYYVESSLVLRESCGPHPRHPALLPPPEIRQGAEIHSLSLSALGQNLAVIDSLEGMIEPLRSFLNNLDVGSFWFVLYPEPLGGIADKGLLVFERGGGRDRSFIAEKRPLDIRKFFEELREPEPGRALCLYYLCSFNEYLGFVLYEASDEVYPQMCGGAAFIAGTVKRLLNLDDEKEYARDLEKQVAYRTRDLLEANEKLKEEAERRIAVEAEVLRISDMERKRFSADLHDDICQRLAGISMFCKSLAPQEAPGVFLPELAEMIDETLLRTRRYAQSSFPTELDAFGFREAVAGLCDKVRREGNIRCVLSWPEGDFPLDKSRELNIYRIIQEALQNVVKHSRAAEARVEVIPGRETLIVRISDNGRGIPPTEARNTERRGGLGLRSMEYRAHQIGAEYRLESRPGSTVVELLVSQQFRIQKA